MDFCTYFDQTYSTKGWVCFKTLKDQSPSSRMFVLAFDDIVLAQAEKLASKNVIPIKLADIEDYCPALLSIKGSRQPKEYYATISPILPMYIFDKFDVSKLFYTDADMAFWSEPEEIESVMGNKSLLVTDHGFEPPRAGVRFNVGILGYRNDANCREFLEWWRDRCLEWCFWITMPDGRMADQGWLNILHDQPERFKNVLSCPHTGINFAPWNIGKHIVTEKNGKKIIDDKFNLICYHYHEFRTTGADSYYPTGWKLAQGDPVPVLKLIYEPYFVLIRKAMDGVLWGNQ